MTSRQSRKAVPRSPAAGRTKIKCVLILSQERISDNTAKTSGLFLRKSSTTRPNSKNPHAILAAKPPIFGAFFEFGRVVLDFLMKFPDVFAVISLGPPCDNHIEPFACAV